MINADWVRKEFHILNLLDDRELNELLIKVEKASHVTTLSVEEILRFLDKDVESTFPRC